MRHQIHSAVRPSLITLALLSLAVSLACSSSKTVFDRTEIGTPAPAQPKQLQDFEVAMLDAPTLKLSELVGKEKVIVLDFWATWCGPCRQEIPHLNALQRDYKEKGVEIIGLTLENPQADVEKVRDFAKAFEINYRLGFSSPEMFSAFNDDPRMPIPQTFIFSRDGNLVDHIKGMNPRTIRERLQEGIEKALKGSNKAS